MDGLSTILTGLGVKNEKLESVSTIIYEIFKSIPEDIQEVTNNMSNMSLRMRNKNSIIINNKEYNHIITNFDAIASQWTQHVKSTIDSKPDEDIKSVEQNKKHEDIPSRAKEYIKSVKKGLFPKWCQRHVSLGTYIDVLKQHQAVEDVGIFLEWWMEWSYLGKLHILGLTTDNINNCTRCLTGIRSYKRLYDICVTNPYKLAPITLDKCQDIMTFLCKTPTEEQLKCGDILRNVYENTFEMRWAGTPTSNIPCFDQYRNTLIDEYGLIDVYDLLYLKSIHRIEGDVATYLDRLIKDKFSSETDDLNIPSSLAEEQRRCVQLALDNSICIIMGGAGTGKTTVIKELVNILTVNQLKYVACSFTAKAVSRLKELIPNVKAATIHRLIYEAEHDSQESTEPNAINRNPDPIEEYDAEGQTRETKIKESMIKGCEHLIIDEATMVSTGLFYKFIKAYPHRCKITIVGDTNQLPPIEWGTLMDQIQQSNRVPTFQLITNHRQGGSAILDNANALINPTRILSYPVEFIRDNDFYQYSPCGIEDLGRIIKWFHTMSVSIEMITAICPKNKYRPEINKMFQRIFLSETKPIVYNNTEWRIGDRVMHNKNNYKIGIMNGDVGVVKGVNTSGVVVNFPEGKTLLYRFGKKEKSSKVPKKSIILKNQEELEIKDEIVVVDDEDTDVEDDQPEPENLTINYIEHCFALTVHKSQGSEYPVVLIYIPKDKSSEFLNLNMLYTAITRAKTRVCIIGDSKTINAMACQQKSFRYEALKNRLIDLGK
jgi:hypothetical protein